MGDAEEVTTSLVALSRTPVHPIRLCSVAVLCGLAFAGCSVSAPPGASSGAPGATDETSLRVAPFDIATPGSDGPITTIRVAPELEALLPDNVAGTSLSRSSGTGSDVFRDDAWSRRMTAFLTDRGKSPADFRYAQAWDPTQKLIFELEAFRVPGVDGAQLADAVVDAVRAGTPDVAVGPSVVAGRPVTSVAYPDDPSRLYVYERDDTVFVVASADPSLVTALIGSLP
jgi:hypothetical protein